MGRPRPQAKDSPIADQKLPTPLYHQILLVLRERVEQGYYSEDGLLPSEQELSREFGVSRITVSRSIRELAEAGLVERRRGAGTRVVQQPVSRAVTGSIDGFLENLSDLGKRTQVKVLEFGFVKPSVEVQRELQVTVREVVQRAVRVRSYQGRPFSYLTSFVPGDIGSQFSRADMEVHSLLSLLETTGYRVGSAQQSFGAVLADPTTGPALEVAVGAPLLSIQRTVSDTSERPVEFIRILYRPDRYKYLMQLDKQKKGKPRLWYARERAL
ncbi:MAG: GntR family transcriptional regulator [Kiloniellales bacterium]